MNICYLFCLHAIFVSKNVECNSTQHGEKKYILFGVL